MLSSFWLGNKLVNLAITSKNCGMYDSAWSLCLSFYFNVMSVYTLGVQLYKRKKQIFNIQFIILVSIHTILLKLYFSPFMLVIQSHITKLPKKLIKARKLAFETN